MSQVIAAIDWVVAHRTDDPANPIQVIVVVAAAGNDGTTAATFDDPATDPFVIAAGAASTKGTVSTADDDLATFTSGGASDRTPDVLAPGESVLSLRDPGSSIDNNFPSARSGTTLFRGSGTSQAAAVTSAAVALLLQARPSLLPDQVSTALSLSVPLTSAQSWTPSTGSGQLEDARGASRLLSNNIPLTGEYTVWGTFYSANWAAMSAIGRTWIGGTWMGNVVAGNSWTGTSFAAKTWAGTPWFGVSWGGSPTWTDPSWSGRAWSGRTWSGARYASTEDWSTAAWN